MEDLNAPIPGSSLTQPPGNRPYERPVEISDPEAALQMHLNNLEREKAQKALADVLQIGFDIETITTGILRQAVAAGRHSVDVSMIIGPVIHEYIRGFADTLGIDYDNGFEDPETEKTKRNAKLSTLAKKELGGGEEPKPKRYEPPVKEDQQEARGLMQRRNK